MLIIIDKRIPKEAKKRLSYFGDLVELSTQNITYSAISGHPDIFLCQTPKSLICAPNLPENYQTIFKNKGIDFILGNNLVGSSFPETSFYNCLVTEDYLFHKKGHTDKQILKQCEEIEFINLPQAYTRCSLIAISPQNFISSDKGIEKALRKHRLNVHYFSSKEILLPDMPHGFIGGALGLHSNKLFVIGNPDFHSWGNEFKALIKRQDIELISLYNGSFFDGGGIFFLE
ncbi:MAG: hypothetical protein J7K39_10720 [Bacteroidales bacterium]|nr:hypothetical protein [Bacteroidales bacterium]